MLRFPLNESLILMTNLGIIKSKIIKATNDYLVLEDVLYDNINLGGPFYIDRIAVVGFKKCENNNVNSINNNLRANVINFNEALHG